MSFHPRNSRRADVERPDEWRIDIDPMPDCAFETVRHVAHVAYEVLDDGSLSDSHKGWWRDTSGCALHAIDASPLRREPDLIGLSPKIRCREVACEAELQRWVAELMDERSLHVEVHREEGMLWARVSEWPGCFASGETLEELMEAIEDAISMYATPEDQPLISLDVRVKGLELRVGSERPLLPARPEASAGPLSTPPRINSPHRDWGFGRFDRR